MLYPIFLSYPTAGGSVIFARFLASAEKIRPQYTAPMLAIFAKTAKRHNSQYMGKPFANIIH
jgi:hypothetical protein